MWRDAASFVLLAATATPDGALATTVVPPPSTPKGLSACADPFVLSAPTARSVGERFEYEVEVIGLSLGLVHIETARRGVFEGQAVTELRGWIDPDPTVSTLVTLEGRASALVADASATPVQSTVRYRFRGDVVAESQRHSPSGLDVRTELDKNGARSSAARQFSLPVHDFLSGFMVLRGLPRDARGCTVVVANDRAYTVWVEPRGSETLETGRGRASFDKYALRYGSDKTRKVRDVLVWISSGPDRIPYQAAGLTSYAPKVKLSGYRKGKG